MFIANIADALLPERIFTYLLVYLILKTQVHQVDWLNLI